MKSFLLSLCILFNLSIAAQNIASISGTNVSFDNGKIQAAVSGGTMTSLNVKNQSNLLNNAGKGYFSYNDNDGFYSPTSLSPQVKINNSEIADIYFVHTNNFVVEMHYVFRKDESGFYTYFVISDNGLAYKSMAEIRFALRVDKDIFNYAWTIEREGPMIHPDVLANHVEEIQDATYRLQDGSIYTKYDWSVDRYFDTHHGLMGNSQGIWTIEASREYINGGPSMQDLTLHGTDTTPILLNTFQTTHYGNWGILLKREYETFSKLWGPSFTYINSGTNQEIIADAAAKAVEKQAEWPYTWLVHDLYPLNRGVMTGTLEMNGGGDVANARVFLSKEGPSWHGENEHWQRMPYDYFFMTEADASGNFTIEDIIPGTYTLYAYTQQGKLIEELKQEAVVIAAGANAAGTVVWDAGDKEETIFQIGSADHKSGEYKLGDLPRLYGRWFDSPLALTYNTETDNPRENWYYCQQENSDWDIQFPIESSVVLVDPILKIALSGTDANPHLEVWVNGQKVNTTSLGSDSGIRRSSLTAGKYTLITLPIDKNLLVNGANTITLKCIGSAADYKGVMYDTVLLEADIDSELGVTDVDSFKRIFAYSKDNILTINSNDDMRYTADIYAITGKFIKQIQVHKGTNKTHLNSKGMLLIIMSNGEHQQTLKVIHN